MYDAWNAIKPRAGIIIPARGFPVFVQYRMRLGYFLRVPLHITPGFHYICKGLYAVARPARKLHFYVKNKSKNLP